MYTYPVSAPLGGTTADALAFLKSPTLIARRVGDLISGANFLSHYLLKGRYTMTGGALVAVPTGAIKTSGIENIAPGAEYPLVALSTDAASIVQAMKRGFGSEISDESVGRLGMNPIEDALQSMAYAQVLDFDSLSLAAVGSAITQTTAGTGMWSDAAAGGSNLVGSIAKAKNVLTSLRKGYGAELALVMTNTQFAAIQAPLLNLLPRETNNPVLTGAWPSIMGVNVVTSDALPSGWVPTLIDVANLGGIGHEDIPSPEYTALSMANGSGVEVARFREKNDSTRIQIRKPDAPVVLNADAGVKITGVLA